MLFRSDIDPEKAKEAQAKLQELEDKKLLDEGKVEELIAARTARMRADFDNQTAAFNEKIKIASGERDAAHSKLSEVLIDNALRTAAVKAKVRTTAMEDIVLRGQKIWRLKDGVPVPMVGDLVQYGTDPNKPMTMDEWVDGLSKDAPHLFEPSGGGGAQNNPNSGQRGNMRILSREEARNPAIYRAAKEQAEKAGIQLQIASD